MRWMGRELSLSISLQKLLMAAKATKPAVADISAKAAIPTKPAVLFYLPCFSPYVLVS